MIRLFNLLLVLSLYIIFLSVLPLVYDPKHNPQYRVYEGEWRMPSPDMMAKAYQDKGR
jgi:hypothetical protein